MTSKPEWMNVARPEQTKADADDLALAKKMAQKIKQVRMRSISRHSIDVALEKMPAPKQERAKYWLNHYRIEAKKGEVAK